MLVGGSLVGVVVVAGLLLLASACLRPNPACAYCLLAAFPFLLSRYRSGKIFLVVGILLLAALLSLCAAAEKYPLAAGNRRFGSGKHTKKKYAGNTKKYPKREKYQAETEKILETASDGLNVVISSGENQTLA